MVWTKEQSETVMHGKLGWKRVTLLLGQLQAETIHCTQRLTLLREKTLQGRQFG